MIEVNSVSMSFEAKGKGRKTLEVLSDISFNVAEREVVCILGPSGCGKTTLLNILGGFLRPVKGSVKIEGEFMTKPSPSYLFIFQDYKLLPWRTVRKNIELGFEASKHGLTRQEIDSRIDAIIESVGLRGFEEYRPREISGGMKQRVAIARALVLRPKILFMDEPFGALDALTRDELRNKFRKLMKSINQTVVMVTHNLNEAIYFSDRIIVMKTNPGRILSIVDVELPPVREEYTVEFHRVRDEVFRLLNE